MKRFFPFAFAAILTCAGIPTLPTQACERCHAKSHSCGSPHCSGKHCGPTDNSGLLDLVDAFAGRVQAGIKKTITVPDVQLNLRAKRKGHCDGQCDGQPTCGCERQTGSRHTHPPARQHVHAAPAPLAEMEHYPPQPSVQPLPYKDSDASPSWEQAAPPTPMKTYPSTEPEKYRVPQPLPDSSVNPFIDEAAHRGPRVPAQTIQYQRPTRPAANATRPAYGTQFDSQARDKSPASFRINDNNPPSRTATPNVVAGGSRRIVVTPVAGAAPTLAPRFESPRSDIQPVVQASARADRSVERLRPVHGASGLRPAGQELVQPATSTFDYYHNPLR